MSKFALSIQNVAPLGRAVIACAALGCSFLACSDSDDDANEDSTTEANQPGSDLSFFVTSSTQDGNLGGLMGADAICDRLATAVGAGDKTWRAYLSAENGGMPVHARERIGAGPWMNAMGMMVAANLTALHAPTLVGDPDLFITEKGEKVNGQWNGAAVNEHDIMTGSDSNGMLIMTDATTCADWTSNTLAPGPQVGHSDGMGPSMDTSMPRFTSWNGGHASRGCSSELLSMSGSTGRLYCFAAN
jgi:hypothetical protein